MNAPLAMWGDVAKHRALSFRQTFLSLIQHGMVRARFKGGQVFTVMFAWIISAIAAILVIAIMADPFEGIAISGWVFGLIAGIFGGWLTVRQISKAQRS